MPNYAQAAVQIRQKKEREAREKEIKTTKEKQQKGNSGLGQEKKVRGGKSVA